MFATKLRVIRRTFAVEFHSTAKLGGASAIQASLIAFGLHELCSVKQIKKIYGRQD